MPGKITIATKGYTGIIKQFIKAENGQTNLHGTVKVSGARWQSLS
ncbi:MAG: hypothetical protein WDO71_14605 [Bacteroidota bacterium]